MDIKTLNGYIDRLKSGIISSDEMDSIRFNVGVFDALAESNLKIRAVISELSHIADHIRQVELAAMYEQRMEALVYAMDSGLTTVDTALLKLRNLEAEYTADLRDGNLRLQSTLPPYAPRDDLRTTISGRIVSILDKVQREAVNSLDFSKLESDGLDWKTRQAIHEEEALNDIMADFEDKGCEIKFSPSGEVEIHVPGDLTITVGDDNV